MKTAYFAGGCFWCITPTFQEMDGVFSVTSGYSGGQERDPSYEDVKYQRTGHRETIRIDYDPEKRTYGELMDVFLSGVDPFDEGGQFIDRGFSYTLAVYYLNPEQKTVVQAMLHRLQTETGKVPYVAVEPFKNFYAAEEYHQDYDLKNPEAFRRELVESGRIAE